MPVAEDQSIDDLKAYIDEVISDYARNDRSIQDSVGMAVEAKNEMGVDVDASDIGDYLVSKISSSRLSHDGKALDFLVALTEGLGINKLNNPEAYLKIVLDDAVNTERTVDASIQLAISKKQEMLSGLDEGGLTSFIQSIKKSKIASTGKGLQLSLAVLDSFQGLKLNQASDYLALVAKDFAGTGRPVEQSVEMAISSRRHVLPAEIGSEQIVNLVAAIPNTLDDEANTKRAVDLVNAVTDALDVDKLSVFNALFEVRDDHFMPFIKAASERLGEGKEANKARLSAYKDLIKGEKGIFGRRRPDIQELKEYALLILKPSQYGIAYNAIEQSAFKMGIWHWSGDPERNAMALAKAAKAFDGETPDGTKIQRMMRYVDGLLEKSDNDSTLNPYPRAISFLQRILQSDMPMSEKAREQLFDKIVDLTLYGHENIFKDGYSAREFDALARVERATEAYFSHFTEEGMHPADLERLNIKKQEAHGKLTKLINSRPVSDVSELQNAVQKTIEISGTLLGESGREKGYEMALDIIANAANNEDIGASGATQLLSSFDFRYHMPESLKERYVDTIVALNVESAVNDDTSEKTRKAAIDALVQVSGEATLQQKTDLVETFASQVVSPAQTPQMEAVYELTSKVLPSNEGVIFVQPSFSAGQIDGQLYITYNKVTAEGGVDILVHNGEIQSLTDAARAFGEKYPTPDVARGHERKLRHIVREGAYVAAGIKTPYVG